MNTYAKSALALVATVISGIVAALTGDNIVDAQEWINVGLLLFGAAAVFTAPNVPGARYTKAILAVLTAVFTLGVNFVLGGFELTEVLQLVVAGLAAVGVYRVPNAADNAHVA